MWVSVLLLGAAEHLVPEPRGWVEGAQTHGAQTPPGRRTWMRVEFKKGFGSDCF